MTKSHIRSICVAGVILAMTLAAIFLFYPRSITLTVQNTENGDILLQEPLQEGDSFSISFIHSVNQSPVWEIFQVQDGQLYLIALEFYAFGAGIPTELTSGQTLSTLDSGRMRIEGINNALTPRYLVPRATEMSLLLNEQEISFDTIAPPGTILEFSLQRRLFS